MNHHSSNPQPDFTNLLKVLRNEKPTRPTPFEFFLNDKLYSYLAGEDIELKSGNLEKLKVIIKAFFKAGYDYATIPSWYTDTMTFPKNDFHQEESRSINEGCMITDWESFEKYQWPDPEKGDYYIYSQLQSELPDGMKLIACGPSGVLENVIDLVGYESLSIMSLLNPGLTEEIFTNVGSRLLEYYKINDITEDMKYDGKHSFEDGIIPVEKAITKWGDDIAILGGIDMDYLVRKTPQMINERARKLLEQTYDKGGYALGSGNSIPNFVPYDNYFAMLKAVKNY